MKKSKFHRFDYENFYLWDALPLVKVLFVFIAGILCSSFNFVDSWSWYICFGICFSIYITLSFYRKKLPTYFEKFQVYIFIGILFFLGASLFGLQNDSPRKHARLINFSQKQLYAGIIKSEVSQTQSGVSFDFLNYQLDDTEHVVQRSKVFFRNVDSLKLNYGDFIVLEAQWNRPPPAMNPGAFDYRKFLEREQIFSVAYVDINALIYHDKGFYRDFRYYTLELRNSLENILIKNGLVDDELGVGDALLLGKRSHISKEMMQAFSAAGTVHILAVSGLHVGMIYAVLLLLFRPIRSRKYLVVFIILSILWTYAFLTGLSPSVLRATVMFSFVSVGNLLTRKANILNILAASAFFLLLFDVNLIYKIGFQLSYLAVWGIVVFQPYFASLYTPKYKAVDYLWQLITVSIAAQLATAPVGLYYFHQFPNYFIAANLLAIPLAFAIVIMGLITFAVSPVSFLTEWTCFVLKYLIKFLNYFISKLSALPGALAEGIKFDIGWTVSSYLILLFTLLFLMFRYKKFLYPPLLIFNGFIIFQIFATVYNDNKSLIIFHDKQDFVLAYRAGNTLNYQINNYDLDNKHYGFFEGLTKTGITQLHAVNFQTQTVEGNPLFVAANQSILLLDTTFKYSCNNKLDVDYCVLSNNAFIDFNSVRACLNCNTWVILANNSYKSHHYYLKQLYSFKDSSEIYDIKKQGYYVYNIKNVDEIR